jgi:hypothetical protein
LRSINAARGLKVNGTMQSGARSMSKSMKAAVVHTFGGAAPTSPKRSPAISIQFFANLKASNIEGCMALML